MDARLQREAEDETEAQEDPPPPKRQVPPPPLPPKREVQEPKQIPKHEGPELPGFDASAEVIALKGKGKAGAAYVDGHYWQFGNRGTFAPGKFQDQSEGAQLSGGRRQNERWRSGSGRHGNKSKSGNSGWNHIYWTLFNNQEHEALKLFKSQFPSERKPPCGWQCLNGEGVASRWVNQYRGQVIRANKGQKKALLYCYTTK